MASFSVIPVKTGIQASPPYQVRGSHWSSQELSLWKQGAGNYPKDWIPVFTGNSGFLLPQEWQSFLGVIPEWFYRESITLKFLYIKLLPGNNLRNYFNFFKSIGKYKKSNHRWTQMDTDKCHCESLACHCERSDTFSSTRRCSPSAPERWAISVLPFLLFTWYVFMQRSSTVSPCEKEVKS